MAWYTDWFNREYSKLYQHRSDEQATLEVYFILSQIELPKTANVLDIACGNGRHAQAFAKHSLNTVGIDYSLDLLKEAALRISKTDSKLKFIRGDMRELPFEDESFSLACSLFTSFGYLEDDESHLALLLEWQRVLQKNSYLVIDFLNEKLIKNSLIPETKSETKENYITQRRSITSPPKRVEKEISITNKGTGKKQKYFESVRMYTKDELDNLLVSAGLTPEKHFGDFNGGAFLENSPRLIVFAKKLA